MDEEPDVEPSEAATETETVTTEPESHAESTVAESEPPPEEAPKSRADSTPAEAESHAETTAVETETHAESTVEGSTKGSIDTKPSISLGSPPESKHSGDDDGVINLEGGQDEYAEQTAVFEEGTAPGTPKAEGEEAPEGEAHAGEDGEKQEVIDKPSHDQTDQIEAKPPSEDMSLDNVRKSITDPATSQQAKNIFGLPRSPLGPVVSISSSSEEEEEEDEPESDIRSYLAEFGLHPERRAPINREQYEEEYRNLKETSLKLRRKNGLLNKKVSEYYRKRKLTRVFEETNIEMYETLLDKYDDKIADYQALQLKTTREKEAVDNEINDMLNLRDEQLAELGKSFTEMQDREQEIGHGLIDSNTGKAISDKVVERLLLRQKVKSEEIAKIRLAFIKRRDKVKQIDNKIKALETIGGTLHLMDFEQLRMENQTFSDKIEERDEELMRLRDRYSHAMQALAHIREKINIIEVQIEFQHDKKDAEEMNVCMARENLNELKIQRDNNRAQNDKLKQNTGLLTYSKLLLDMEIGIKDREELRDILKEQKDLYFETREKLVNIRNLMDKTEHILGKSSQRKLKSKHTTKSGLRYYSRRPTITYPVIPKIAQLKARLEKLKLE